MDVKNDFLQFHVGNDSLYVAIQVDAHSTDSGIVHGVLPEKGELHLANSEVCATIPPTLGYIFSYLNFLTSFEKRYGAVTFFLPLALDLT